MEPLNKGKQIEGSSAEITIISLHTKHSGHQPGTDTNKLLLPVHPIVVSLAMENLKRMVSTSTVALASKNEEIKIMSMVEELKHVTFYSTLLQRRWSK